MSTLLVEDIEDYNKHLRTCRKIIFQIKDRNLVGFTDKNFSSQDDDWKNFTKQIYKNQKYLYENGFPVFEVGRIFELLGFTLYEEFSKKADVLSESLSMYDIEKFYKESYICSDLILVGCFGSIYSPIGKIFKKGLYKYIPIEKVFLYKDKNDWVYDAFNIESNFLRLDIYQLLEKAFLYKRGFLWKSLFLVENVKRKVVRLFRKDISLDQKDLLMNVLTTKSGDSKEKQKERH